MNLLTSFHSDWFPHSVLGCLAISVFQSQCLTLRCLLILGQLPQVLVGKQRACFISTLITLWWQQTATAHCSAPVDNKWGNDWFFSSENYSVTDPNVPEASTASCIHWLWGCNSLAIFPTPAVVYSFFPLCCAFSTALFWMNQIHLLVFFLICFLSVMNLLFGSIIKVFF